MGEKVRGTSVGVEPGGKEATGQQIVFGGKKVSTAERLPELGA